MRKLLALLLALTMLFGLVACNKDKAKDPADADVNQQATSSDEQGSEESDSDNNGEMEEALGYEDEKFYTFQTFFATTPSNWNPHNHETIDDGDLLGFISSDLYTFDWDLDHPEYGYTIKTEMAADLPEDLTKEYAGDENWNVPKDAEKGYVYRIKIIDYAAWDDGTPITAADYIYSIQEQLNPKMQNHRADLLYNGGKIITRAKDYVYQGTTADVSLAEYVKLNGLEDIEALLDEMGDEEGKINWANSFGEIYDPASKEWSGEGFENANVESGMTLKEIRQLFQDKVAGEWGEPEETAEDFFQNETFISYTYPELDFDKVGVQQDGDYAIILFLDKPLEGFQFYWNCRELPLVKKDLYEECKVQKEGEELVTSTYGTSLEKTASYGPYKLSKFQDDKVIEFVRNENWYGYHDEGHKGMFQADRIYAPIVKEPATRLQMFLSGQLDLHGLSPDQVDDYRGSDYIYYTLSQYTGCLNLCADMKALEARQEPGINKTILTNKDFRKALVWSIDRADFAASTTASSSAGFGLLNTRYIADVDNVVPYRNFDDAKKTLLKVYGMEYGEGTKYETLDDAYAAMTAYDLDAARKLFDQAYEQALADGLLKEDDKIKLDFYASEDNESTRKTYNYLKDNWEKAMKGTKLEGKFELGYDPTAGNDFGKNFKNGLSDMMQAGWSGAGFDPFYLISAYLDPGYRYAQNFDTSQKLTLEIEGEELTMSIDDWYNAMMGNSEEHNYGPSKASLETRIHILAAIEAAVLEDYTSSPLTYGASASLRSQKVEYFIEDFNELLGRGSGVDYLTFNYSDDEWEAYVKEQGGELDYK